MINLGDFVAGSIIGGRFNTSQSDGTPITFAGSPTLTAYKANATANASGITLTVDKPYPAGATITGLHYVAIDTTADTAFYANGNDYDIVISAGTVNSVSQVGRAIFRFSLRNRTTTMNVIPGKVTGTCTTQTIVDSSLSAYKSMTGRVVVWRSGGNIGSAVQITAHTDNGTTLTVQTMGTVPSAADLYDVY